MEAVALNGLTKYYGKHRGIEDVTFSVEAGEIFGFIGPNGAGKSTTIRTLLGLIYPTSGSATIFGRDCIREGPVVRRDVGYLPSEVFYYEHMKAKDLLKYSAGFYRDVDLSRMNTLAERLELDLDRRIDRLSYGNKKKVGIIQGLLHAPKLIILDEPTGGLDPLMQQTFFDIITEENKRGATVLFSSHILGEVQRLCTRVAIIREGRVIKVEQIARMREDAYRKVKLELKAPVAPEALALEGVADMQMDGTTLAFLYKGDAARLVGRIHELPLHNVWIEEPTLEEIFMHYYRREA